MIQRRTLITLPGAIALAAVQPARAQAQRVARIGFVGGRPSSTPLAEKSGLALMEELRARGWAQGGNLQMLTRFTEDRPDLLPGLVAELVAAKVELIMVFDDSWAAAVRGLAPTMPIVFTYGMAPVELGLVASLARPGGNVTGVASLAGDLAAKQIELARSLRPDLKRVAVMWFPASPLSALVLKQQQVGATKLGMELVLLPMPLDGSAGWDAALATVVRSGAQMFAPHLSQFVLQRLDQPLADWAIEHRIVALGPVEQGFVMSYVADPVERSRMVASFVDRILRGAKPADLPVEQARHFRLGLNARTAKAMRLTIPKDLLARADQVIQ